MATTTATKPKTYVVKYDGFGSLDVFDLSFTVEVSATDEQLHEINNFWGSSKYRLKEAKGDITLAVVRMMCIPVMMKCQGGSDYLHSVNEIFKEDGWHSDWFKITDLDFNDLTESSDFMIKEVTTNASTLTKGETNDHIND